MERWQCPIHNGTVELLSDVECGSNCRFSVSFPVALYKQTMRKSIASRNEQLKKQNIKGTVKEK